MANFNKVILAGNLTRDPELRYTPKGTAIARIGLAINRSWTSESGEKKEEVTFVDVDAFGRQAEVISQYLKKGRPILVEGRLKYDTWDDKQTNQKKSKLGVVLESFQFMDGPRTGNEGGPGNGGGSASAPAMVSNARPRSVSAPAPTPAAPGESEGPPPDDDVPF